MVFLDLLKHPFLVAWWTGSQALRGTIGAHKTLARKSLAVVVVVLNIEFLAFGWTALNVWVFLTPNHFGGRPFDSLTGKLIIASVVFALLTSGTAFLFALDRMSQ